MTGLSLELEVRAQAAADQLTTLADELQVKAIRSGLHSAGGLIVKAMRAHAPDDPRTPDSRLARAINKTTYKSGKAVQGVGASKGEGASTVAGDQVAILVGPNKGRAKDKVAYIGRFLEHGTKPHRISSKTNKQSGSLWINGRWHTGSVMHPGIKPRRWMARAADSVSDSAFLSQFYKQLERYLERQKAL